MIKPYYEEDGITLYCGRCDEILPELGDKSVDVIFTDPPYGHNNNNGDMASRWEAIFEGRKEVYDEAEEFRSIANEGPGGKRTCPARVPGVLPLAGEWWLLLLLLLLRRRRSRPAVCPLVALAR